MCQAALADLKMAIRAAGEHKQRIAVQVSIDGLRLRDEKTGVSSFAKLFTCVVDTTGYRIYNLSLYFYLSQDCLYHHPVHKISFIAQDMSDSRAFGYIFGSPDTGHRFFGIKTDKAASQVGLIFASFQVIVFFILYAIKKNVLQYLIQCITKIHKI